MNNVIQELTDIIREFQEMKSQPVNWVTRPLPSKWSKKEIIGHLIDSA